jgi:N-acetylmuramoyl-L-alanine amidase
MSRQSFWIAGWVAGFFIQAINLMLCSNAVLAETAAGESNSFIACTTRDSAGFLCLDCSRRQPIPAPQISYLPGEEGEVIMVVDFDGVAWNMPARVIRVSTSVNGANSRGIKEIRISRMQQSPPVSRISVVTTDAKALRAISFKSIPGRLEMHWPVAKSRSGAVATRADLLSKPAPVLRYLPVPMTSGDMTVSNAPALRPAPANFSQRQDPICGNQAPENWRASRWSSSGLTSSPRTDAEPIADLRPVPPIENTGSGLRMGAGRAPGERNQESMAALLSDSSMPPVAPSLTHKPRGKAADYYSTSVANPGDAADADSGRARNVASAATRAAGSIASTVSTTTPELPASGVPVHYPVKYKDPDDHGDEVVGNEMSPPLISLTFEQERINACSPPSSPNNVSMRVNVVSDHALSFNSFRLSNPERYVMDFSNCPELVAAQLPDVSANEFEAKFVRSIRVGKLVGKQDGSGKTRLVIDLLNDAMAVKEQVRTRANIASIVISRNPALDNPVVDASDKSFRVPSGTTIVLDAGHGGTDPGAQRGDVQEKEITLDIVDQLRKLLLARGFKVIMTRSDDTFVSLEDRVRITNSTLPDLFLSVHINAMESANDIHGVETYYQTEQSRALADAVHESLVSKLEAPDKGVRKARFYVINHTSVPAILAEVGFISNKDERDKLISSDYQKQVAEALRQGVMLYLNQQVASKQSDGASVPFRVPVTAQMGTLPNLSKSNIARIAERKTSMDESAR